MIDSSTRPARRRWMRARAAIAGIGLGAITLAPMARAQTPPVTSDSPAIPTPALPQQSFAPLVKRVLPAVVNISVTESAKADPMADQLPEQFRNSPFDQMLRRFFDQQQGEDEGNGDQPFTHRFGGSPDEGGVKRIALGSG